MPTPELEISRDYKVIHGLRSVTLGRAIQSDTVAVSNALRTGLQQNDALSQGHTNLANACVYVIWVADLQDAEAGATVEVGDTITDGSEVYVIVTRHLVTNRTRYRCMCRLKK